MLGPQRPTPTRGVHDMAFTGTPRHNSHSIPNPSFHAGDKDPVQQT
ncbi:hypothetical protein BFJ66_g3866 [Fusarium oxysporum f. sp. cepae]|nr:hypothetical protein BFJ66_g3866 [Fusarium oxysporum f. sp. cepae]